MIKKDREVSNHEKNTVSSLQSLKVESKTNIKTSKNNSKSSKITIQSKSEELKTQNVIVSSNISLPESKTNIANTAEQSNLNTPRHDLQTISEKSSISKDFNEKIDKSDKNDANASEKSIKSDKNDANASEKKITDEKNTVSSVKIVSIGNIKEKLDESKKTTSLLTNKDAPIISSNKDINRKSETKGETISLTELSDKDDSSSESSSNVIFFVINLLLVSLIYYYVST